MTFQQNNVVFCAPKENHPQLTEKEFPFGPEISPKIRRPFGISLLVALANRDVMRPKRSQQKNVILLMAEIRLTTWDV